MTQDQIVILLILASTMALFIYGRWRHDVVALASLLACVLFGLVPAVDAFAGFGHPAVITVACVLVLSYGLQSTGVVDALFLKVFSGEVVKKYRETVTTDGFFKTRTLSSGKSAQWPILGDAQAKYHVPGESLYKDNGGGESKYLQKILATEREIFVDAKMIAVTSVSELDALQNHYETRADYAEILGNALANKTDRQRLIVAVRAARANANIPGVTPAGTRIDATDFLTSDTVRRTTLRQIAEIFDANDVPKMNRNFFTTPEVYYKLVEQGDWLDKDFNGPNGSKAEGIISKAFGIRIVPTNHLPNGPTANIAEDVTAYINPTFHNTYHGDFRETLGVACTPAAVGSVMMQNLSMEVVWSTEYQAWMLLAKKVCGANYLRPECAIEVYDDSIVP